MKILLAIDRSDASQKAIQFVANIFATSSPKDLAVTVFHVWESLPESGGTTGGAGESAKEIENEAKQLVSVAQASLVKSGLPAAAVTTKLAHKEAIPESKQVVACLALIEELQQGGHDVVCLGRRGHNYASGSFIGSVAEKVLRDAGGKTVWVVD